MIPMGAALTDVTESKGFGDGFGHWYTTDPSGPDPNSDGLSDSEETGELVEIDGRRIYSWKAG